MRKMGRFRTKSESSRVNGRRTRPKPHFQRVSGMARCKCFGWSRFRFSEGSLAFGYLRKKRIRQQRASVGIRNRVGPNRIGRDLRNGRIPDRGNLSRKGGARRPVHGECLLARNYLPSRAPGAMGRGGREHWINVADAGWANAAWR